MNSSAPDIEARQFRRVLGLFATGVVAVTALDPATGRPVGLAANSFTAVTLRPPLVCVSVAHTSTTWPKIRAARGYCINILAEHQRSICLQLAAPGAEKFRDVAWTASPGGHPILEGALGWLECGVDTEHETGDHVIVISRVLRLDMQPEEPPLIFYRGGYGRFETALTCIGGPADSGIPHHAAISRCTARPPIRMLEAIEVMSRPRLPVSTRPRNAPPPARTSCQLAEATKTAMTNTA